MVYFCESLYTRVDFIIFTIRIRTPLGAAALKFMALCWWKFSPFFDIVPVVVVIVQRNLLTMFNSLLFALN